jgi:hypothetical protein
MRAATFVATLLATVLVTLPDFAQAKRGTHSSSEGSSTSSMPGAKSSASQSSGKSSRYFRSCSEDREQTKVPGTIDGAQ